MFENGVVFLSVEDSVRVIQAFHLYVLQLWSSTLDHVTCCTDHGLIDMHTIFLHFPYTSMMRYCHLYSVIGETRYCLPSSNHLLHLTEACAILIMNMNPYIDTQIHFF